MKGRRIILIAFSVLFLAACGGNKSAPVGSDPQILPDELIPDIDFTVPDRYDDYAADWKKVAAAEKEGKPRTALEEVTKILDAARAAHNVPQIVKALVQRTKYEQRIGEKQPPLLIASMETEIAAAQFPEKNLLHSITADMYESYFQMNRWRFYERTDTTATEGDLATWSLPKLMARIAAHHHAALEYGPKLREIQIELLDEVLTKGTRARALRPTLYDLIAHRAVDFFMNDESSIAEGATPFEVSDTGYLMPAERFATLPLTTTDTNALAWNALTVLQELTRAHLRDRDTAALIDIELKRLAFVRSLHTAENKEDIYLKTLELLEQQYGSRQASARVGYELARLSYEKGSGWREGMPEADRMGLKDALAKCGAVSLKWPDSEGDKLCKALSSEMTRKFIQIQGSPAVDPDQPSLALLKYRNVKTLYFRTVKLTAARADELTARHHYGGESTEKTAKELAMLSPRHEWQVPLPDDGDLREHRAEVPVPPLERGDFALLCGTDPQFTYELNALNWVIIRSSRIAFQHRVDDRQIEFFVADRSTGRPLSQAKVEVYETTYDYATSGYKERLVTSGMTGKDGIMNTAMPQGRYYNYGLSALITQGGDRLKSAFWSYPHRNERHAVTRTYFFTDRAIYRPGQTIYFKGITIQHDATGMPTLVKGRGDTVEFYDANHQKAGSLNLTTNDYGSFHGSFTAPGGALNGRMMIRSKNGNHTVSVEEYKRPLFETGLDAPKGSYRLGDEVTVEGFAKSYAGTPLTDAKVQWYVEREVRFPYYFGWWGRSWFYDLWNGKKAMIGKGETVSGPDGRYIIRFTARPDKQIPKEDQPYFSYRVHAEVTDINGETHPAERFVQAAYSALNLSVGGAQQGFSGTPFELELATTNMSGEPEPSKGTVTISRLKDGDRLLRKRLFYERPDRYLLDKAAFIKQFPHDPYGDEDTAERQKEKEYLRQPFDTAAAKKMTVEPKEWPAGDYLIEATAQDRFGQPMTTRRIIPVRAVADAPFTRPLYEDIFVAKDLYEPGETAELVLATGADAVTVVLDILRGEKEERSIVTLDRTQKVIRIPVTEADRGNIAFRWLYLKHGRSYMGLRTIMVPWSNKQLKYEFLSFRSTLQPGEKEQWRIKITGPKGETVAAELAATLYDGSLDAFLPHNWYFSLFPQHYYRYQWLANEGQQIRYATPIERDWNTYVPWPSLTDDALNYFGMYLGGGYRYKNAGYYNRGVGGAARMAMTETVADEAEESIAAKPAVSMAQGTAAKADKRVLSRNAGDGATQYEFDDVDLSGELAAPSAPPVQIRKNLQETAFFYPQLMTDEKGELIVSFTVPEALTTWKMLGLAYTKELASTILRNELKTQKEIMVAPNVPRFLREGDRLILSAKISNMTDAVRDGVAELKLMDARTMADITADLAVPQKEASFSAPAKGNAAVQWQITVPKRTDPVVWRIVARAGDKGDGEENTLPVLSNRMLVTETLPLPINGKETKNFTLQKLKDNNSQSLTNHRLTLEFTSNPAWYAVQALPYLIEYPYECAEQVFSRYYANSLASHIVNKNEKIAKVFAQWKGTAALDSNLMKNEELKSALLQETPWVLDGQNEAAAKRRVALLFDLNRMGNELKSAFNKLRQLQVSSGGWPWFPGLPEDRYITQHITAGLGKLKRLGVATGPDIERMTRAAVGYLDRQMQREYEELLRAKVDMQKQHISYMERHYLYTRSFFVEVPVAEGHQVAFNYWKGQAATYWVDETPYMTGLTATALFRFGDTATPAKMVASLKERAIYSGELGMYWKENMGGYYWFQFPIETQAALIEAFEEVAKDGASADKMKTWLIKMKQVQNWRTTKATADAVYALLYGGSDWLAGTKLATVTVGGKKAGPAEGEPTPEAGTGYFKTSWPGAQVTPAMAQVTVQNPNPGPAWGALYWQYFEELDKITAAQSPLSIERQILREKRTDSGAVLEPITGETPLKVGDKIAVRLVLRVDRDMEYLHLKDGRPAGTEPVDVLSGHDYRDGLWFYRVTKDVSTNFFIHRAVKGTYVLEYRLTVTLAGNYSAGLATAQCMYAPEFAAHSAGSRLTAQ